MNRLFIKFVFKMALRSMSIHKLRTALTILAITWSVATLVALRTVGVGIKARVSDEVNELLQADILIMERSLSIPEQVSYYIASIPHVKDSVGTIFIPAKIGKFKGVNLVGVPVSKIDFFNLEIINGSPPISDEAKEIIIDSDTAKALGITAPGTMVKVVINYGTVYFEGEFKVVAIMESRSFLSGLFGASFVVAPLKPIQEMLGREGFVNYIFIKIDDRKLINDVARAIKRNYPGADIVKQTDIVNVIIKVMDIIDGMLMAVTVIGLLVAALGVMNTVMMSIRERIREIGILKTIGAGGTHVLLIFLSEVIIMGVSGGVLGIVAGYSGSFILRDFVNSLGLAFEIPILLVPEAFMLGFCVSLTVSILAALYPIYKAVKIRPIEALKIE